MRMRLHLDREDDGIVVLESEPQLRSMFFYGNNRNVMRVPLPYIFFVIRYVKQKGKFIYPGIYGSGLHVFGKLTPLTNVSDEVLYLPTDLQRYGLVCTDHDSDNKEFDNPTELVSFAATMWWSLLHRLDYNPFDARWDQVKLDELNECKWISAGSLRGAILRVRGKEYGISLEIPIDFKIVDMQWPTSLETSPGKEYKEHQSFDMSYKDADGVGVCPCGECHQRRAERERIAEIIDVF